MFYHIFKVLYIPFKAICQGNAPPFRASGALPRLTPHILGPYIFQVMGRKKHGNENGNKKEKGNEMTKITIHQIHYTYL